MLLISLIVSVLALLATVGISRADEAKIFDGECGGESHIAEGPIGADLTKRQSRFFCNSAVIEHFNDDPKHVMLSFVEKESAHARQIAYAGHMIDKQFLQVENVYLEAGKQTPVTEGSCKLFSKDGVLSGFACGAKIDDNGLRTVPIVAFDITPTKARVGAPSSAPYVRHGVVNCALPGTAIDFALIGDGDAQVARIESNYAPFRLAASKHPIWKTSTVSTEGKQLLIIDNGAETRIIVSLKSGRGAAYAAEGSSGASEILCQILVSP